MAATITVDLKQFEDLIPRMVNATRKTLSEVVRQQAKLLIRGSGEGRGEGLVPYTPPPLGQEQGKAAVSRDINRVFLTASKARQIVKSAGLRGISPAFNRALKSKDQRRILEILNASAPGAYTVKGYTTNRRGKSVTVKPYTVTKSVSQFKNNALLGINSVAESPSESIHKRRKGRSGRVRRDRYSQLVLQSGSLAQYIKQVQRRVGIMKAGWRKAAQYLGVTLPTFVKNAPRASGDIKANLDAESPSITMTNSTPNASANIKSVLDRALRGRRIRMQADIERKMKAALEKQQTK